MQGGINTKKEEKKEEPKKLNNLDEKFKKIGSTELPKKEEKNKLKEEKPKSTNPFLEKINKLNNNDDKINIQGVKKGVIINCFEVEKTVIVYKQLKKQIIICETIRK